MALGSTNGGLPPAALDVVGCPVRGHRSVILVPRVGRGRARGISRIGRHGSISIAAMVLKTRLGTTWKRIMFLKLFHRSGGRARSNDVFEDDRLLQLLIAPS